MKYVIDIPGSIEQKVRELISRGEFHDVNHFVNVAVENQLNAEKSAWGIVQMDNPSAPLSIENRDGIVWGSSPEKPEPKTVRDPSDNEILDSILWGQYYRFLPVKFSVKLLARLNEGFPALSAFKELACDAAEDFGKQLRKLDVSLGRKSGEKISVSFPDHTDKSRRRFKDQYVGFVRSSDGKSSGLLLALRFAGVTRDGQIERIGLTESGKQFALLDNPVLDQQVVTPIFSQVETDFLVRHICHRLPEEARHMGVILDNLVDGIRGRADLNVSLERFYKKYQPPNKPWTKPVVNLMRAGAMSRMWELGMIEKTRTGLIVEYKPTSMGESYRQLLLGGGD